MESLTTRRRRHLDNVRVHDVRLLLALGDALRALDALLALYELDGEPPPCWLSDWSTGYDTIAAMRWHVRIYQSDVEGNFAWPLSVQDIVSGDLPPAADAERLLARWRAEEEQDLRRLACDDVSPDIFTDD